MLISRSGGRTFTGSFFIVSGAVAQAAQRVKFHQVVPPILVESPEKGSQRNLTQGHAERSLGILLFRVSLAVADGRGGALMEVFKATIASKKGGARP